MTLGHGRERGEEAEGDEGHPVARHSGEVLPGGREHDRCHEQARGEIAAQRAHVRVGELHGPLDRDDGRGEEQRGEERVAEPAVREEHGQRRPPGDVRALDVEKIDAAHADHDPGDAEEARRFLERHVAQPHEDEQAHLPERRHHGDGRELERLGQRHGRDDLAHREEEACPDEAGLDRRRAVPEDEERGERQQKGEASPHCHVLVELVAETLHHGVPQHLAERGRERQGFPHAGESTRARLFPGTMTPMPGGIPLSRRFT